MKVLALVYPGMTLLDLVGPLQAWSFLPGYEVQYVWHRSDTVPHGLRPRRSGDDTVLKMLGLIQTFSLSAAVRSPHWTCWAILPQSPF